MEPDSIMNTLQEWYGPQRGMKVYLTVMPGIMADFNRMMDRRPGETVCEEYKLEDGKGSIVLSGWKKQDGTAQIRAECRRS